MASDQSATNSSRRCDAGLHPSGLPAGQAAVQHLAGIDAEHGFDSHVHRVHRVDVRQVVRQVVRARVQPVQVAHDAIETADEWRGVAWPARQVTVRGWQARSRVEHRRQRVEALDFDRVARGVAEEHRRLFAGLAFEAQLRLHHK